jgi:hypothetical protein
VKVAVKIAFPPDQASQLPHKLTLTNDDGSYTKTLTFASDAQPGDTDGTSVVTFEDLSEEHTYTVQCDDGTNPPYSLLDATAYDQLVNNAPPPSSQSLVPDAFPSAPAPDSSPGSTPSPASSPASSPAPASSPSPGSTPAPASSQDPVDPGPPDSANGGTASDVHAGDDGSAPPPSSQSGNGGAAS